MSSIHSSLRFCTLISICLLTSCKSVPIPETSYAKPFTPAKVAQLSHEAYLVAWDVNIWAKRDLDFASFTPTSLDWDVSHYLDDISHRVAWIARKIEKHPDEPRAASRHTVELVRYKTILLRKRYAPTSFAPATRTKIERLLRLLDEISTYYELKQPDQPPASDRR